MCDDLCFMLLKMLVFRKLGEGVYEMTCTLKIAIDLLSDPKGYKYVVFSPKMVHEYDCFEYLHTFIGKSNRHQNPNRCLIINPADRRDGMFTE